MRSLFEKNVERMRSELTDLKCAQKRGLGTIRFYTKTVEATIPANTSKTIRVTLSPEGLTPGVMELSGGPFYHFWTIPDDTTTQRSTSVISSAAITATFMVVSSVPLVSLEVI